MFQEKLNKILSSSVLFLYSIFLMYLLVYLSIYFNFNYLEISFLDVGQGDSILIKSSSNRYFLIDAGDENSSIYKLANSIPFFRQTIDIFFLTHFDNDHIGGAVEVIDRYSVKAIAFSKFERENEKSKALFEKARKMGIDLIQLEAGDLIKNFDLEFRVIWPFNQAENRNDNSLVIKLIQDNFSVIFTGDISSKSESQLALYDCCTVLKASHHGSKGSNSEEFIRKINPVFTIISVGKNNKFGHPSEETLSRLQMVETITFRTDLNGTIKIVTNGFKMKIN